MFRLRTRLILLFVLIIAVVLVTWTFAQQSYSAYNVTDPAQGGLKVTQKLAAATEIITLSPAPSHTSTIAATATNTNPSSTNCTYPLAYWQQNQDQIPPQILVKISADRPPEACVNYAQSEICASLGETSLSLDVILRQQFLVAIMNYLSGADPGAVANTVNDAYEWLRVNTPSASITGEDAQTAQLYAGILQSYNEGEIGPGACDIEIIPLTQGGTLPPSPTVGSAATASTPIPSPTMGSTAVAFTPTITSAPTVQRTVVVTLPTSTEEPEQEPEPTWTPIPPSDTEPPPTDTPVPQPTATEIPPPTSTDLPTPTPVPEIATPTPVP